MGFNIFSASAGSGKTFTLTVRYLSLVLNPNLSPFVFREILTITFTNKAVNELKTRIINALKDFSSGSNTEESPIFLEVQKRLNLPSDAIQKRSRIVLKKILHHYNLFHISTIDHFNHKITRIFSSDMSLIPNFKVSLEEKYYLEKSSSNVLDQVNKDSPIAVLLIEYAKGKIRENKSWNFSIEIENITKLLLNETHYDHFKVLSKFKQQAFLELKTHCFKRLKRIEKDIESEANSFFKLINDNKIEATDFQRSSCFNFFERAKNKTLRYSHTQAAWTENENIYSKPLYTLILKKKHPDKALILDRIHTEIANGVVSIKEKTTQLLFLKNIISNITPTTIISNISQALEQIKVQESIIFISEFNKHISEIVRRYDIPFIYERLGTRYRYYFLDEFQDTSRLQWENLIPLISNTLESVDENENSGELYIVGDAKQAIYRWRGGLPEQFINLYNQTDKPFQIKALSQSLEYNYRSGEHVIGFNNEFFSFLSKYLGQKDYQELYRSCIQKHHKKDTGYVEISFLRENKKELELAYCKEVERVILEQKQYGYQEKDICIIIRKNNQANVISNYLQSLSPPISVATSEALFLNDNTTIQFINHLLQWTQYPESSTLYWSISYYLISKREKDIYHHQVKSFIIDFEKNIQKKYHFYLPYFYGLSLYESLLYIINCFDIKWNNYIQSYLDVVVSFTENSGKGYSIFDFLNYWEKNKYKLSATTIECDTSVNIMTIHKSKGLEFPVVICPFVDIDIYDEKNGKLWYELDESFESKIPFIILNKEKNIKAYNETTYNLYKQSSQKVELDNINLLYVMFTRAEEQLYIITNNEKKPSSTSNILSKFLESKKEWQPLKNKYIFGEIFKEKKKEKQPKKEAETNIHISLEKKSDRIDKLKTKRKAFYSKPSEIGILVHDILSKIQKKSDIDRSLKNLSIRYGIKKITSLETIKTQITSVVTHPELELYFSDKYRVLNEKDILNTESEIIRPDKVIINDDEAIIIDFKTGKPKKKHIHQMEKYATVLKDLNYKVTKKILVYVKQDIELVFL